MWDSIKHTLRIVAAVVLSVLAYLVLLFVTINIIQAFPGTTYIAEDGTETISWVYTLVIIFLPPLLIAAFWFVRSMRQAQIGNDASIFCYTDDATEDITDDTEEILDPKLEMLIIAAKAIVATQNASISTIQRYCKVSYWEATSLMDDLEALAIVAHHNEQYGYTILVESEFEAEWQCRLHYSRLDKLRAEHEEHEKKKRNEQLLSKAGLQPSLDFTELDAMEVIKALERNISTAYQLFFLNAQPLELGRTKFNTIKQACSTSKFPLAAEIRLEFLLEEYAAKFNEPNPLVSVDAMDGHMFECWSANILKQLGFTQVKVTKASGDQGVDVLAVKDNIRYAIQCKCYSSDLGNTPVQEVLAGKSMYNCHVGVVMTNRYFTAGAKELAEKTGILLWDRDYLQNLINTVYNR